MSYKPTNYKVLSWDASASYNKDDIVTYLNEYWYATQQINTTPPATGFTVRVATTLQRRNNILTISNFSSVSPSPARGSHVAAINAFYPECNYTGVLTDATSNSISYINAGPDFSDLKASTLALYNNRAWTTGFGWIPSYTTSVEAEMSLIDGKFTEAYSQKQRNGINTNMGILNLVFDNITSREARAISNYIQEKGGVDPIKVNMGDGYIGSNVAIRFILEDPTISTKSYDVNSLTVKAKQVFDPL